MAKKIDLNKFEPSNESDLLKGIFSEITVAVQASVADWKKEISVYIQSIAKKAWLTLIALRDGTITKENADLAIHTQELALNNVLLLSSFAPYDIAQKVLNAVFSTISAAIKNITGVQLQF